MKIPITIQHNCPKCECMIVEIDSRKNRKTFRCINPDCRYTFDVKY